MMRNQTEHPEAPPMRMYSSYRAYVEATRRLTNGLLLFLMATTAFYTFRGASVVLASDGGGLMDRMASMVYAMGTSAMIYLFWRHAMNIVPPMTTRGDWLRGFGLVVLGAAAVVAISSWLNVMALAGAEAQKIEMHSAVARFERAHDAFARRLGAPGELRGNLIQGARSLEGWAQAEARQGAVSGYRGRGSVHAALRAAADQMSAAAGTLEDGLGGAATLGERARGHLAAMRAIAESQEPLGRRMNAFAAEADRLRAVLIEIGGTRPASAIAREMQRIAGAAVSVQATASGGDIARAQTSALARVQAIRAAIAAPLAEAAREVAARPPPEMPEHTRVSTVRAVWDHAGQLVPYWAGGIGLDLMPALLILFLSVLHRALHPNTPVTADDADDHDDMTIREVRRARRAIDKLLGRDDKADRNRNSKGGAPQKP